VGSHLLIFVCQIGRTDLDAILDRYKDGVDPETRAALGLMP
jgi:hypothetical protein